METSPSVAFLIVPATLATPAATVAPVATPAVPAVSAGPAATGTNSSPAAQVLGQPKTPAAGTAAGTVAPGAAKPLGSADSNSGPSALTYMLPFLLLFMGLMLFTSFMTSRKDKKKRALLFSQLGSGDKVQTYSGIIGSIAEISGDEVVLRTDEGSNTRIRMTKAAISSVLRKQGSAGASSTTEIKQSPAKAAV